MDKYVGKKLDGRYEIRELIGIGGMANVYRCYDTIDDREVAIKILKDEFLNNEEFIRRFKNESKAIAVLSHPNIVKVYDVSFGDMIQYIVMEYIDGITLKEYINQQNVLTWKETVHLVTQVLAALSHAHSKGVVHRDIKPQNMMLLSDGTIKVTDFGIARFSNSTRTMTEQAIGSVHYIAPEQAKGDITDGKTDIYSIGIMMYEMLTGKLPFDGENAVSVALMHLQVEPPAPRSINASIPEGIEEIILKAMQKQPVDRYQSAQDMLADIERFRMNPSVRFEYKYLYDKQPTKYIEAVNKGKTDRAAEYAKVVKDTDDEKVRHSLTIPIITGVLIALFLALVICIPVGIFKNQSVKNGAFGDSEAADVDVPDLLNMSSAEANEYCKKSPYDLEVIEENKFYSEYPVGIVIDQEPKPGSKKIKANGKITIFVNRQEGDGIVPDVTDEHFSKAILTLNGVGFYELNDPYVIYSEDVEEGKVIGTFPKAGTKISLSTPICIYVAGKNATTEKTTFNFTDILGMNEEDALDALKEAGFEEKKITFKNISESGKPKGEVVYANILCGEVGKDDHITVYISDGTPLITVPIPIDMPVGVSHEIRVKVLIDDKVFKFSVNKQQYDEIPNNWLKDDTVIIPGYNGTKSAVKVFLDGEIYREYEVDFAKESYKELNSYEYNDPNPVTTTVPDVTDVISSSPSGEPVSVE